MDKTIKGIKISFLTITLIFQFSCSPKVTKVQTSVPDANKKPIQKDSGLVNISTFPPVTDYLAGRNYMPTHPRILLLKGQEQIIKNNILQDNSLAKVDNAILTESDKMLLLSPLKRVMVGNQILETSREALRRIFYLSYAYRTTHQIKYFNRAEQELISVCAFSDWNPQQSFLDCAEMTTAVAIGYDWLFDNLSADDKSLIKSAIVEKGLKPSLDPKDNFWLKWTNNWNQVCNTGMALGAMAIYEDDPRFARMIINRAIETIRIPMNDEYSPNGCFIEGYSYWNYGTGYNVLFLAALQKLFGTDFDLNNQQGFVQTGTYFENMTSPDGATFNYSDSFDGDLSAFPDVSMFWFANQLKKPSLLWVEHGYLVNSPPSKFTNNRFLPMLPLLDSGINTSQITPPTSDLYVGQGKNPVAMMRSSWTDPNAIYVGVKAGSPAVSHGHMDVGSFVMDVNGVRWAADPGGGNYNKILAKGVNLWDESQNSTRWKSIFEYTNMAHNTLTVNNANQKVNGKASFIASSENPAFRNVVADLTSVYSDLLTKAIRGVAIVNNNYVAIRDEITPINSATLVKWSMLTPASVSIISNNKAELTLNGQKLLLQVQEPSNVILKTWSVAFTNTYAAASKGNTYIGFETNLLNSNVTPITVLLIPEDPNVQSSIPKVPAIKDWPKQ